MLTNCVITIFHKNPVSEHYGYTHNPAWYSRKRERIVTKNGEELTDTINIILSANSGKGNIVTGDYIVVGQIYEEFGEEELRKFISNHNAYKVYSVNEIRMPGGMLHHSEVVCI